MTLWECKKDGIYRGFGITQVTQRGLLIFGLYGVGGEMPADLLDYGWNILKEYARDKGCKEMYYITRRRGMARRFQHHGLKEVQQIFSVEV